MIKLNRRKPVEEKKPTERKGEAYSWLLALNAACGQCIISIEPDQEGKEFILPSETNPEIEIIKKDLFENLSDEAKEIIRLIINGPSEIVETFSTEKYQCVSKDKIRRYFRRMGWSSRKILRIFFEIKKYTKEIDEIRL